VSFGSVQFYNDFLPKKNKSFGFLIVKAIIAHLIIMLCLYGVIFFMLKYSKLGPELSFRTFIKNPLIATNFLYALITNTAIVITIYLNSLFGRGILFKLITGQFYIPKEEFRVFMFLDLESSTQHAENLAHIKYSKLIQDCFYDMRVIAKTKAEVYQYVGDEAVLTWKSVKNIDDCLLAFFLFKKQLQLRSDYYNKEYDFLPSFKAGVHIGLVTVTEVGGLKREIAYHGDTLNIASRIQGLCKTYNENILISSELYDFVINKKQYKFKAIEELILRGKKESTLIYAVDLN
jgi:adenylate cyclase